MKRLATRNPEKEINQNSNLIFDKYKILNPIGFGNLGIVHEAVDIKTLKKVAIKELVLDYASDENQKEIIIKRFLREMETAGNLNHENIVQMYDIGQQDGKYYLVMEYVEGKTLRDYLDNRKSISIKQNIYIILQICKALNHAHNKNIIHRDIKPENIKVNNKLKIKIMDFGTAKVNNKPSDLTTNGTFLGTPVYMAPEQFNNPKMVDSKADIYSLGVIMYELFTNKLPFEDKNLTSLVIQIMTQEPKSPIMYNDSISHELEKIIMKAIQKDIDKRYTSLKEIFYDLKKLYLNLSLKNI